MTRPAPRPPLTTRVTLGQRSGALCSFDTTKAEADAVADHVRRSWESVDIPGNLAVGTGTEVTTWLRLADICSVSVSQLPGAEPPTRNPEKPAQGEGGTP